MYLSSTTKRFFFKFHTSTLPVNTWLQEKGIVVPWSTNCRRCDQPETIVRCFIACTDAYHFWDVLQRALIKDLYIAPCTIRFLPVPLQQEPVPYDLFLLLGLHSLRKCSMIVRNAGYPRTVRSLFNEVVKSLQSTYQYWKGHPEWMSLFTSMLISFSTMLVDIHVAIGFECSFPFNFPKTHLCVVYTTQYFSNQKL